MGSCADFLLPLRSGPVLRYLGSIFQTHWLVVGMIKGHSVHWRGRVIASKLDISYKGIVYNPREREMSFIFYDRGSKESFRGSSYREIEKKLQAARLRKKTKS
jgi:hypothetical protein